VIKLSFYKQNVWRRGPQSVFAAEDYTIGELHSEASSSEYDIVPEVRDGDVCLLGSSEEVQRFVEEVVQGQAVTAESVLE